MDRALDDIIGDRQRGGGNGNYRSRDRRPPRDGVRKPMPRRDEPRNLDSDWVHDRYYDDDESRGSNRRRGGRGGFSADEGRRSPDYQAGAEGGTKIRVDNLHYDLTEEDIRELFLRKGAVSSVQLLYDRQDRSKGTAFVTMPDSRDARDAVREYDGANANAQPIRVTLLPSAPAMKPRNPFDTAERPGSGRSLFDRVEKRSRSESPIVRSRRSDVRRPPPENIDRYTPGGERGEDWGGDRADSRRRSPLPRRGRGGEGGRGSRRPGERRPRSPRKDNDGHTIVQGRPRKTQEELDAEMEDYWGSKDKDSGAATEAPAATGTGAAVVDDDIDMIE